MGAIELVAGAGIAAGVCFILWWVSRSGEEHLKAELGERDVKTAAKIADAVAGSPRDDDELSKRLLDPNRKL